MSIPIQELAASFEQVKQRKGSFGKTLDYVDVSAVIQRLNNVLEDQWSFNVIQHEVDLINEEVRVLGQLQVGNGIRQQWGGSKLTRNKDTGDAISIADDLKAATSDTLKKCAVLFGVGLYLYSDGAEKFNTKQIQSNSNGRITSDQIVGLFQIAKQQGLSQPDVIKLAKDAFGTTSISQLTSQQGDELYAMILPASA